ncbi:MAG: undecaprenyl-diphosphate phosphatase [Chloroflexi bacterium]|nr:undecaprenyl-diphosphate phosphatase [Chloroflexota bacterium]
MSYRVPVTLGVVQGLSEFLPISSSAHLIIVPRLLGWPDPGLAFDVALHVGTLLAVLGYFWRDWLRFLRSAYHPSTADGRLFWCLVLATLPGGLVGIALDKLAEEQLRSLLLIAATSATLGVLLWLADRYAPPRKELDQVSWTDALLVGAAQALAIVPGVSRSGITICVARAREMTRETAARFSFLLSTPIIAGAAIFKLRDLQLRDLSGPFFAGVLSAALAGALTIGLLLRYLQRSGFGIFAAYRLALAVGLVLFVLLHG